MGECVVHHYDTSDRDMGEKLSALDKAKRAIMRVYGFEDDKRKWLVHHFDSYGQESNRVSMFVWEGSPPKGWVVKYGCRVTAYDMNGHRIYTFTEKK